MNGFPCSKQGSRWVPMEELKVDQLQLSSNLLCSLQCSWQPGAGPEIVITGKRPGISRPMARLQCWNSSIQISGSTLYITFLYYSYYCYYYYYHYYYYIYHYYYYIYHYNYYIYHYISLYICIIIIITVIIMIVIPVVAHKAVAEVSKIGNL